jgi:hypothetical protein
MVGFPEIPEGGGQPAVGDTVDAVCDHSLPKNRKPSTDTIFMLPIIECYFVCCPSTLKAIFLEGKICESCINIKHHSVKIGWVDRDQTGVLVKIY